LLITVEFIYKVKGNTLRFLTLTPTLSHRERELKEVAINGRSKYNWEDWDVRRR
jgi:hypothetical protein